VTDSGICSTPSGQSRLLDGKGLYQQSQKHFAIAWFGDVQFHDFGRYGAWLVVDDRLVRLGGAIVIHCAMWWMRRFGSNQSVER
jgi:hypothetical protein